VYLQMKRLLLTILIVAATNTVANASGIGLKFPPTARSYALGESLVANSKTGAEAIYFNPAGLSNINLNSLEFSAFDGVSDIAYNSLSYFKNIQPNTGLGVSLGMLNAGEETINELDGSARSISTMKDTYLTLAAGKKITPDIDAGLSLKIISSNLAEEYKANGFAVDMGILYSQVWNDLPISIGASLQNIGTGLKYEKKSNSLPTNIRIGGAVTVEGMEFMAAVNKDKNGVKIGLGAEYYPLSYLALRAGYKTGYANQGLSLGFGITRKNIGFDYAYCPITDLDSNHRVSMGIRF
ncbi:MAG: PorV/PorQ family protein, partial [Candidatus Desantisbacteria bacterium]